MDGVVLPVGKSFPVISAMASATAQVRVRCLVRFFWTKILASLAAAARFRSDVLFRHGGGCGGEDAKMGW
jgi:hypothetical protein